MFPIDFLAVLGKINTYCLPVYCGYELIEEPYIYLWTVNVNCNSQDLTAVGITQPVIRKRLTSEISKLHISDGIPNYIPVIFLFGITWVSWVDLVHCFYVHTTFVVLWSSGYIVLIKLEKACWLRLRRFYCSRENRISVPQFFCILAHKSCVPAFVRIGENTRWTIPYRPGRRGLHLLHTTLRPA